MDPEPKYLGKLEEVRLCYLESGEVPTSFYDETFVKTAVYGAFRDENAEEAPKELLEEFIRDSVSWNEEDDGPWLEAVIFGEPKSYAGTKWYPFSTISSFSFSGWLVPLEAGYDVVEMAPWEES
jgi:hypothetical protein